MLPLDYESRVRIPKILPWHTASWHNILGRYFSSPCLSFTIFKMKMLKLASDSYKHFPLPSPLPFFFFCAREAFQQILSHVEVPCTKRKWRWALVEMKLNVTFAHIPSLHGISWITSGSPWTWSVSSWLWGCPAINLFSFDILSYSESNLPARGLSYNIPASSYFYMIARDTGYSWRRYPHGNCLASCFPHKADYLCSAKVPSVVTSTRIPHP